VAQELSDDDDNQGAHRNTALTVLRSVVDRMMAPILNTGLMGVLVAAAALMST
jgi:hypothetical protein